MQIWHLHEVQDRSQAGSSEGQRELGPSFACGMWTYGVWHMDVYTVYARHLGNRPQQLSCFLSNTRCKEIFLGLNMEDPGSNPTGKVGGSIPDFFRRGELSS